MTALTMWKIIGVLALLIMGISGNQTGFSLLILISMYKFVRWIVHNIVQASSNRRWRQHGIVPPDAFML